MTLSQGPVGRHESIPRACPEGHPHRVAARVGSALCLDKPLLSELFQSGYV